MNVLIGIQNFVTDRSNKLITSVSRLDKRTVEIAASVGVNFIAFVSFCGIDDQKKSILDYGFSSPGVILARSIALNFIGVVHSFMHDSSMAVKTVLALPLIFILDFLKNKIEYILSHPFISLSMAFFMGVSMISQIFLMHCLVMYITKSSSYFLNLFGMQFNTRSLNALIEDILFKGVEKFSIMVLMVVIVATLFMASIPLSLLPYFFIYFTFYNEVIDQEQFVDSLFCNEPNGRLSNLIENILDLIIPNEKSNVFWMIIAMISWVAFIKQYCHC